MKNLLFSLIILCAAYGQANAQQTVATAGGEATGSGGSVSYTMGQIFYATQSNSNGTITEGVQQAYEIFVISSIEEAEEIKLSIKAYPNPTVDILTLDLGEYESKKLVLQVYDLNGSLLQMQEIHEPNTKISLEGYAASTYLVRVIDQEKEIKTFKIIKR